jgi:hypothetical protein
MPRADLFMCNEVRTLLQNKYVLFIGDSVIRSMYKDLVKFLQTNNLLTDHELKVKGEYVFQSDNLIDGGLNGQMTNDTSYREVREYHTSTHRVKFIFITRCYSEYLVQIAAALVRDNVKPDVVLMNSGNWDLTRYGANSVKEYKANLPKGLITLAKCLSSQSLFIWFTTLPVAKDATGGFLVPEIEHCRSKLRDDIIEANYFALHTCNDYKLDCIDLHFYFRNLIHRRALDGIHWDATAHRRISNLILSHVCDAWDIPTPGRLLVVQNAAAGNSETANLGLAKELMQRIESIKKEFDVRYDLNWKVNLTESHALFETRFYFRTI